jgi:soluble lytic murein transglycosylase-like protein
MRFNHKLVVAIVGLLLTTFCSASEYAVMRNGFALKHERREVVGEITRLYLTSENPSSFVDVPSSNIERFEKDEVVIAPELPEKTAPAVLTIDQSISQAGEKHHIDPDFITSVVRAESGFRPRAISPKGARGLMQLMPKTAAGLGVKDSFDGNENVEAGTRYLRQLLEQFNYDAVKALAAYNAGPDRVAQYHGVPPYSETRNYVARIVRDYNRKKSADDRLAAKQAAPAKVAHPRKKAPLVADSAPSQH